jgi:hypothetical protein
MNDFLYGMETIGQLFPAVLRPSDIPSISAWQGVASSFAQAGNSIRTALDECNAQRESQQTA